MLKSSNLNIRIAPEIKEQAESIYSQFGITLSDAVSMFFHQSILEGGLPFKPKAKIPNAETVEAMREANQMLLDKTHKTYGSFSEILAEIEGEINNEI